MYQFYPKKKLSKKINEDQFFKFKIVLCNQNGDHPM
jgi:hypothetical protein